MTHPVPGRWRLRSPRFAVTAGLSVLGLALAALVLPATNASAHGSNASPGSRTYLCFQDSHWTGGDLDARNPACQEAIATGGKQPLWDWYGVGNSSTKGRTRGYIPDGKICSGNNPKYAAYDKPRADWPATHLTSGSPWRFRFPSIDGHPGTFYLYTTKDGYDPTKPLTWDDLEEKPFDTATFPSPNASGPDGAEFAWDITLPAHKTGRHLLLSFWQRSDADGSFFNCSDVVFDGGNGEISGYPNDNEWQGTEPPAPTGTATAAPTPSGAPTSTVTPTAPTAPPTAPTTTGPGPVPSTAPGGTAPGGDPGGGDGGACTAQVGVQAWSGGYLGTVTVLNRGPAARPWTVTFTVPAGLVLYSGWNADVKLAGTTVTATAPSWNRDLATGDEVSVGFVAAGPSTPPPGDVRLNGTSCTSGDPQTVPPTGTASVTPSTTPTTPAPPVPPTTPAPPTGPAGPTATTTSAPGAGGPTATEGPAATAAPTVPDGTFVDGFESQTGAVLSGPWAVTTENCSGEGAASVDTAVSHSGARSLRIDGAAGYCNHVFVKATKDLSALGPTIFARMYIRHTTAQPVSHTTFLAMRDAHDGGKDLRVGGQNGALQWNRESDDATLPEQSPAGVARSTALPTGTWQCVEIEVNGATGTGHTWLNGSEIAGLTADGKPTADIDRQWYAKSWKPAITNLRLGWESYAGGTDTLWFDDVAIGTSRIGC